MSGPRSEVSCPNCRGGNPPSATHCQWCGYALYSQPAPVIYVQVPQAPPASVNGWGVGLLIVGILGVLGSCGLSVLMLVSARSAFQEQSFLLFGILLVIVSVILFVVPGIVIIVVSRRR